MNIQTKITQPEEISFLQACKAYNEDGSDICDKDWDMGIYLGFDPDAKSVEDLEDAYDKFCFLLALNLKCKGLVLDWYTPCNICEFVEAHRKSFDILLNDRNRYGRRPMDYTDLRADKDTGYYEVYMESMEALIAGNYSDDAYAELVLLLLSE